MIKIEVFKDRDRYESDLAKMATTLGLNYKKAKGKVWERAKEATSRIDFVQRINPGSGFYDLKPKEQDEVLYTIGYDVAKGRAFKVTLV